MKEAVSIKQFVKKYKSFTENNLRWLLRKPMFENVIRRIGSRIYILPDEFFKVIRKEGGSND